MSFTMVIAIRPQSAQKTGSNSRYAETLRQHARAAWGDADPLSGQLYARLLWFRRGQLDVDVDNVAKPILDSLKWIVYADDAAITRLYIGKIHLDSDTFEVEVSGHQSPATQRLLELTIATDVEHVLYVEIGRAEGDTIHLGPPR
jgi:hypothetical protein